MLSRGSLYEVVSVTFVSVTCLLTQSDIIKNPRAINYTDFNQNQNENPQNTTTPESVAVGHVATLAVFSQLLPVEHNSVETAK